MRPSVRHTRAISRSATTGSGKVHKVSESTTGVEALVTKGEPLPVHQEEGCMQAQIFRALAGNLQHSGT